MISTSCARVASPLLVRRRGPGGGRGGLLEPERLHLLAQPAHFLHQPVARGVVVLVLLLLLADQVRGQAGGQEAEDVDGVDAEEEAEDAAPMLTG
jgi:hypothetical protein